MKCLKSLVILCSLASVSVFAQNKYSYRLDLKNIKEDKAEVTLKSPQIGQEIVTFSFPKAIPGSYARKDFGRFIENFTAFDKAGKRLKVEKLNPNQYRISNAKSLGEIKYKVKDTWDERHKDFIFQPGGTNIEEGKNFVVNNHAFFGYLEEYKDLPIDVEVSKPVEMYASTHLDVRSLAEDRDLLSAKNYVYLADNPVLYSRPDTTSFYVGKTKINIAVYSANGKVNSQKVASYLKPISFALQKFFFELPVSSYQFLYYFEDREKGLTDREKGEGGYGALEHNYSSLYYLPEVAYEKDLKSMIYDVSMHEFLHILTPLNLHSNEIAGFDFSDPKMSRHLWMYEGVTEYFAQLLQVQNGLITEQDFFKEIRRKMNQAEEYGNFSMTEMSLNVMEDKWQKKYNSVYNRGTLIGFMLDVFIREKTEGKKDLKSVIVELTKQFGPDKPFNDEMFFDDFIAASHPDVRLFIDSYIIGGEPLNYKDFFAKLGYDYAEKKKVDVYYAGRTPLSYNDIDKNFFFTGVETNTLKISDKDVLISINGEKVKEDNVEELLDKYLLDNNKFKDLSVVVLRGGEELTLTGTLNTAYYEMKNFVGPAANASELQQTTLQRLIGTK